MASSSTVPRAISSTGAGLLGWPTTRRGTVPLSEHREVVADPPSLANAFEKALKLSVKSPVRSLTRRMLPDSAGNCTRGGNNGTSDTGRCDQPHQR